MHLAVIGPVPSGRRAHLTELQPTPPVGGQMALIQQQRHRLRRPQHPVVHTSVQRDQTRTLAQPDRTDRIEQRPHLNRIGDPAPVHRMIHVGRPPLPVLSPVERICRKTPLPHRILQHGIEDTPTTPVVLRGRRRPVEFAAASIQRPADRAGLFQRRYRQRCPSQPPQRCLHLRRPVGITARRIECPPTQSLAQDDGIRCSSPARA